MQKKPQKVLLHIIGSLLFISIPILSSPDLHTEVGLFNIAPFRRNFVSYILLLAFFYTNYLYLIPKLYFNRKYFIFIAITIGAYAIIALLPELLIDFTVTIPTSAPPKMQPGMPPNSSFMPLPQGGSLFQFLLVFSLSFLLRINQRLYDIQSEKQKAEVSYLKAQINPHFLFNTLNSIYALALEKSDTTPDAILMLSSMMRYVVTESSREYVALEKEVNYIKNYINLQQLRIDNSTQLSVSITGDMHNKNIAPLLLIPFIENAFKHGINPEEKSAIEVSINITDTNLMLKVKNNKVIVNIPEEEKTGKGISNTKMRLQHLYPKKHKLLIFESNETFEVTLTLTLQ